MRKDFPSEKRPGRTQIDYIVKPFTPERLKEKINKIFEGK